MRNTAGNDLGVLVVNLAAGIADVSLHGIAIRDSDGYRRGALTTEFHRGFWFFQSPSTIALPCGRSCKVAIAIAMPYPKKPVVESSAPLH